MIFDLVKDFAEVLDAMPEGHPRRRILKLLVEAVRRDVHFIDRHPTTFFQCMWNTCWWYDCEEAAFHYDPTSTSPTPDSQHRGPGTQFAPRESDRALSRLAWSWAADRFPTGCARPWLKSTRPPQMRLESSIVMSVPGVSVAVHSIAPAADGKALAVFFEDGSGELLSIPSGRSFGQLKTKIPTPPTALAYCTLSDRYAATFADGSVIEWSAQTGEECVRWAVPPHRRGCFLEFEHRLLVATPLIPGSLDVYSESGLLGRFVLSEGSNATAVYAGATRREILVGHQNGRVTSVELKHSPAKSAFKLKGIIRRILEKAVPPVGRARVWQIPSVTRVFDGHSEPVTVLGSSLDQELVYAADESGQIRVWRNDDGQEIAAFRNDYAKVLGIQLLRDCRRMITGASDQRVRVWNLLPSPKLQLAMKAHERPLTVLEGSPSDSETISGAQDGSIRVWNNRDLREPLRLLDNKDAISSIAVTTHGPTIACAAFDAVLIFRKSFRGAIEKRGLSWKHGSRIESIAFSRQGNLLACGDREGIVSVWVVETEGVTPTTLSVKSDSEKTVRRRFRAHQQPVQQLCFSPNGDRLACVASDGCVSVWDLESAEHMGSIKRYDGVLQSRELQFLDSSSLAIRVDAFLWAIDVVDRAGRRDYRILRSNTVTWRFEAGEIENGAICGETQETETDDIAVTPDSNDGHDFMSIVRRADGVVIAWLPHVMDHVWILAEQRMIVGAVGNHLFIYESEQFSDPPPLIGQTDELE